MQTLQTSSMRAALPLLAVLIAVAALVADRPRTTVPTERRQAGTQQDTRSQEARVKNTTAGRSFDLRIGVEILRNPFWYAAEGHDAEANAFWNKTEWDRRLRAWAAEEYSA